MKKVLVIGAAMLLAIPMVASAEGLIGDCYDCHTMHNSEQGQSVAVSGTNDADNGPIQNLLKFDCIACHAQDPTGSLNVTTLTGGSEIPQVMHNAGSDLAGGNFSYGTSSEGKAHQVRDLFATGDSRFGNGTNPAQPPGIPHSSTRGAFSSTNAVADNFDLFTCAGARGCHGTRNQLLAVDGVEDNGTENVLVGGTMRTGIAAISGAHHINSDGAKNDAGYAAPTVHSGTTVAAGYRFIPGLKGFEDSDWQATVSTADHNEYYGNAQALDNLGTSQCQRCHIEGSKTFDLNGTIVNQYDDLGTSSGTIANSRMAFDSVLRMPNNSMSGFCSTCHGNFHSSGTENGTSGAFLRHPSDYVIPESGEYAAYDTYDLTAPVARPSVLAASNATVTGDTDMVMCLSCHQAHGTNYDYLLRFDYSASTAQSAGIYADQTTAQGQGGCLACHTLKGVTQ